MKIRMFSNSVKICSLFAIPFKSTKYAKYNIYMEYHQHFEQQNLNINIIMKALSYFQLTLIYFYEISDNDKN